MPQKLYFDTVQRNLELTIALKDNGIIYFANDVAEDMLEYEDGLIGVHVSEILPGEFEKTEDGFSTKLAVDDAEPYDMMAYRKNRTCFHVQGKLIHDPMLSSAYILLMEDQTTTDHLKKQVELVRQEAEEAAKVKSQFVANITHELRTPVNGVLGNTRTLLDKTTDEESLRILKLIERSCNDMNQIINNILDFSKLEAGKFTLDKQKFDFRSMIDYVKSNHMFRMTEKGLDFFVTVSPEVPQYIVSDELRIVQVLNNLLSNATKFTSVGKIVLEVVKTAQVGNQVELYFIVIDTGIGISKEDQSKLFHSFSQVDASISRKYGGTGLGLNISKSLVELMGGKISVESEPGNGTMFSFSIVADLPEEELKPQLQYSPLDVVDADVVRATAMKLLTEQAQEGIAFGTQENLEQIETRLSKLILSVEMENWEKAEAFCEALRELTENAPREVKQGMLRMKMAIQKEDYEKASVAFDRMKELLRFEP